MQRDEEAYQELCRLIEEREPGVLTPQYRDFLLTLDATATGQFLAALRSAPPPEPVIRWRDVGALVLVLIPLLALTGLWGWFLPYDADTPAFIKLLIPSLAVLCVIAGLVIDVVLKQFLATVVLGCMILGGLVAAMFGYSEQATRDAFGEPVNLWICVAVVTAAFGLGEMLNLVCGAVAGTLWDKGRARWRGRRYLSGAAWFAIAAIAAVFPMLWPFKGRDSSGG